jgi:hypothetical protein
LDKLNGWARDDRVQIVSLCTIGTRSQLHHNLSFFLENRIFEAYICLEARRKLPCNGDREWMDSLIDGNFLVMETENGWIR